MSAEGVKKFIAAIDLEYPAPQYGGDKTRQKAWLALMTRTLGGWDDEVLCEAAALILRTRNPKKDGQFFPKTSECEEACHEAAEIVERRRTPLLEQKTPERSYGEKIELARQLMQTSLGQEAIHAGWGQSMFQFCVEHGRAPSAEERHCCRRSAKEFQAAYEHCLRGQHPLGKPLARLAESMTRKARELMEKPA